MPTARFLAATAGAALLASVVAAPMASAEDTNVTFTVTGGSLALSIASEDGALGSAASNLAGTAATAAKAIGIMTVTDETASLAGWTVTASMAEAFEATTDLNGAAEDPNTIPCTAATVTTSPSATISPALAVSYVPTGVLGVALTDTGTDGDCDGTTIARGMGSLGSHTASFTTSVVVTVPADALAGSYAGVLTQTVT